MKQKEDKNDNYYMHEYMQNKNKPDLSNSDSSYRSMPHLNANLASCFFHPSNIICDHTATKMQNTGTLYTVCSALYNGTRMMLTTSTCTETPTPTYSTHQFTCTYVCV